MICLALTGLSARCIAHAADDLRAREIVDHVSQLFVSQSSIATVDVQITKADWQRQIALQLWSLGESRVLVRIRSPQNDAGTAVLKVGNEVWYYLPQSNRTVKMPASMMATSWMGSDFTLDDLVQERRLTDDYVVTTAFEGQRDGIAMSEYTLTPKPDAAVVWGHMTLEVRHADQMPIRQRYYDEDGALVRELTFADYRTMSGRLIPTRLVMQSMRAADKQAGAPGGVLAQGVMQPLDPVVEQTMITYTQIAFDEPVSEDLFVLEHLSP